MSEQRIAQNEKLREMIVDAADIWDGKESGVYGDKLSKMLKECGIDDVPKFYRRENMEKIINKLRESRKNTLDGERK